MSTIIGLLVAAFILVFFEVILPGGILGIIAALCVILASWIAGAEYGAGIGVLTFVGSAAAIGILVFIEFKTFRHILEDRGQLCKKVARTTFHEICVLSLADFFLEFFHGQILGEVDQIIEHFNAEFCNVVE